MKFGKPAKVIVLAVLAVIIALTQVGGGSKPPPRRALAPPPCPAAAGGHGAPGVCAPALLQLAAPKPMGIGGLATFQDRSNNNPCVCGALLRAEGYLGLVAKANQGGFVDRWAVPMLASARRAGLAIGVYDFDQDYTVSEARLFASRARAVGIYPGTRNTFPLFLDVEFGAFSRAGLLAQISYLHSLGYRVAIYTGQWYWTPHAGCSWPGVTAWLSGYPFAPVPCGVSRSLYVAHQFTMVPVDRSIFLAGRDAFEGYVNNAAPPKPAVICWGRHAQPHNHVCRVVRPRLSHYSRARDSTRRALRRKRCRRPYKRSVCRTLGRREHYFALKASRLFKEFT